jgi:hypothetical protein
MATNEHLLIAAEIVKAGYANDEAKYSMEVAKLEKEGSKIVFEAFSGLGIIQAEMMAIASDTSPQQQIPGKGGSSAELIRRQATDKTFGHYSPVGITCNGHVKRTEIR